MDRVFDTVRGPDPVPAGRADAAHPVRRQTTPRPQRHRRPLASTGSRDRETSVGPDHVQGPLRAVDAEGLHQRRTRAALRGDRAQHQTAALRPGAGQVPRHRRPAGRHGRPVHHHARLRRRRLPARRHPRPAAAALPDRRHPGRRHRPEPAPDARPPWPRCSPWPPPRRVHRRRPRRQGARDDRATPATPSGRPPTTCANSAANTSSSNPAAPAATTSPPAAARTIAALLTLREQVIAPILAGVRSPRMGRKPTTWTRIDRDYETLRIDMQTLFHDLGITPSRAA